LLHKRNLTRPLDRLVAELTRERVALLGMGQSPASKKGKVRRALAAETEHRSIIAPHTHSSISISMTSRVSGYLQVSSSDVLSFSLRAQIGPTSQQRRMWLFLRGLTIFFLCTLLHGSGSRSFVSAVRRTSVVFIGGITITNCTTCICSGTSPWSGIKVSAISRK
jgi:hypothetical protein